MDSGFLGLTLDGGQRRAPGEAIEMTLNVFEESIKTLRKNQSSRFTHPGMHSRLHGRLYICSTSACSCDTLGALNTRLLVPSTMTIRMCETIASSAVKRKRNVLN